MTEYFTKEEVLGVIQAGINYYEDLIKQELRNNESTHVLHSYIRKAELEDLLIQFKNRLSTKK